MIEIDESQQEVNPPRRKPRGKLWRDTQRWTRWLHVYTSMLALLVVLFFGLTGVTVNHPEWTFGFDPTSEATDGILPVGSIDAGGNVEFLLVSEHLRSSAGVKGEVVDFGADETSGFISYRGPGYGADVFFDIPTGSYELTVGQQGWIGVFNDLHKGRDTDSSWNWLIDVSGIFLVVIAITGLTLQLLLRKRRRTAVAIAVAGTAITVALVIITVS